MRKILSGLARWPMLRNQMILIFMVIGGGIIVPINRCFAQNPIITSMYTADPSAHVWKKGRLYLYASHDVDPPRGCDLMDKYHIQTKK